MKYEASELSGAMLDAAVAVCLGWMTRGSGEPITDAAEWVMPNGMKGVACPPPYSTDWTHGGPVIESKKITLRWREQNMVSTSGYWAAMKDADSMQPGAAFWMIGPTALTAGMRALVIAMIGSEVDL